MKRVALLQKGAAALGPILAAIRVVVMAEAVVAVIAMAIAVVAVVVASRSLELLIARVGSLLQLLASILPNPSLALSPKYF
jgi:hypothetical protein